MTSEDITKILCCPLCKKKLKIAQRLYICTSCKKEYPLIKGVPVFLETITHTQLESQKTIFNKEYKKIAMYTIHNWQKSFINRLKTSFGIFSDISKKKKSLYVDVGAGSGYTVIEMAKEGVFSIGCDLSLAGMIKSQQFAKEQGVKNNTFFVVCDAEHLPFRENTFDYMSCIMLLEHLKNDKKAVKEIGRVCKPKGRIFISVPNTYLRMWPFLWPIYMMWDKKLGHMRHYTENQLIRMFTQARLRKISVFYTVHLVKFLQLALDMALKGNMKDAIWWKLEKIDFMQTKIKTGLNLNAVFEKK